MTYVNKVLCDACDAIVTEDEVLVLEGLVRRNDRNLEAVASLSSSPRVVACPSCAKPFVELMLHFEAKAKNAHARHDALVNALLAREPVASALPKLADRSALACFEELLLRLGRRDEEVLRALGDEIQSMLSSKQEVDEV